MARLQGKVTIVTGANSGVGAATAKLFAAEGAKVVMAARRAEALESIAAEIAEAGGETLVVPTDISKPGEPEALIAAALEKYGTIDALVNVAGILEKGLKPIDRYTDEDFDNVIATNTKGTMACIRAAAPHLQNGASIVNIASIAGLKGNGGAAYVASKAAIVGVTTHTALRFQAAGIRCNAVCPGNILTPMTTTIDPAELDKDMMGAMSLHNNMRSPICHAEDVANIALFFASDESRSVTGQALVADFGSSL